MAGRDAVQRLDTLQLLELFQHFDRIHAGKENLFIPLSFAVLPAVLATWQHLPLLVVFVAAVGSMGLYVYHIMVCRRFGVIQAAIFGLLRDSTNDIDTITAYPRQIGIRRLRIYFAFGLAFVWVAVILTKASGAYP